MFYEVGGVGGGAVCEGRDNQEEKKRYLHFASNKSIQHLTCLGNLGEDAVADTLA